MATCVLYVDESGDPRKHHAPLLNGETPLFTLTGLALPLEQWKYIDREFLSLKTKFFSPEIARSSRRPEYYEVKGNTLCSPRNKNSDRRHKYLKSICDMVSRYDGKLFCTTVIKNDKFPTSPKSIYTFSLQYLIERFSIYLSEHSSLKNGIIIADSTKNFDKDVAESYMSYIFGNESGRSFTNICEAPLFADSSLTAGLQIVDNLSSTIFSLHYHYYCRNVSGAHSYEHMKEYLHIIRPLEFKSRNKYEGGHIKYGFRVIDQTKNKSQDINC